MELPNKDISVMFGSCAMYEGTRTKSLPSKCKICIELSHDGSKSGNDEIPQ